MADTHRLDIRENVSMKNRTTFRVGGAARYFAEAASADDYRAAFAFAEENGLPVFLLGGGSNLLISDHGFAGLVLLVSSRGIEILQEDDATVVVRVAAGETWDDVVAHAVERGWWGIENMSLIPGTAGAVPIQNVGAYGQDASQVISEVEVMDAKTKEISSLSADACRFAYRKSLFNGEKKGRYIVLSVCFRVKKNGVPNRSHVAVHRLTDADSGIGRMRDVIIQLREDGRLPDLEDAGNAGSFFQSPFIPQSEREQFIAALKERMSSDRADDLIRRCYETGNGLKVPAVGLLQAAGLAEASVGGAALYSPNPAILVNRTGTATAADVLALTRRVRQAVFELSGLLLPVEPERVGFDPVELEQFWRVD
jgi:UDP-N-acetylmuramate dehydrogenase